MIHIKIAEFMKRTNLSNKTSRWLYDNIFSKDGRKRKSSREFNQPDVSWVYWNYPEMYKIRTGNELKRIFSGGKGNEQKGLCF